ncbi:MAG: hypothetical protein HY002_03655 [Candidatus Rokubacteria bacterium]|nr:hypothetical protein [Candidatus Rokubacteria bacterium]
MGHGRAAGRSWIVVALLLWGCSGNDALTDPPAEGTGALRSQRMQSVTAAEGRVAAAEVAGVDMADLVDALFLGSGPLIPRDGTRVCPLTRVWSGFLRGTTVRVRVSTTVDAEIRDAIRRAVLQVSSATNGVIRASFELTDDPNPLPGPNEVTATVHPDPRREGCPSEKGCIQQEFLTRGVLGSGRALEPPGQTPNGYVRDVVGRGILGMCRIDGRLIGGAGSSLMSAGPGVASGDTAPGLTHLDVSATRFVYASPLSPGATRTDFLRAGLVNLQVGERQGQPPS